MDTKDRKVRKTTSVEDIEAQIRKLTEKKKAKQLTRWIELGKFTEGVAKGGRETFDQSAFFAGVDKIMKGESE